MKRSVILPRLGKKIGEFKGFERIGPEKKGERIIIPIGIEKDEINKDFGASKYLIVDIKNGNVLLKKFFKNPYSEINSPRGARFAKVIRADKIFVRQIGESAKKSLENFGIETEIISSEKNINDILEEARKKNAEKN